MRRKTEEDSLTPIRTKYGGDYLDDPNERYAMFDTDGELTPTTNPISAETTVKKSKGFMSSIFGKKEKRKPEQIVPESPDLSNVTMTRGDPDALEKLNTTSISKFDEYENIGWINHQRGYVDANLLTESLPELKKTAYAINATLKLNKATRKNNLTLIYYNYEWFYIKY